MADRVVILKAGVIQQVGTPQQLYEHPHSEFVAGFMGEAMLFAATASADGQVQLGPLRFQARRQVRAGPVKVAVRTEAWAVTAPGIGALDGGRPRAAAPSAG